MKLIDTVELDDCIFCDLEEVVGRLNVETGVLRFECPNCKRYWFAIRKVVWITDESWIEIPGRHG